MLNNLINKLKKFILEMKKDIKILILIKEYKNLNHKFVEIKIEDIMVSNIITPFKKILIMLTLRRGIRKAKEKESKK